MLLFYMTNGTVKNATIIIIAVSLRCHTLTITAFAHLLLTRIRQTDIIETMRTKCLHTQHRQGRCSVHASATS